MYLGDNAKYYSLYDMMLYAVNVLVKKHIVSLTKLEQSLQKSKIKNLYCRDLYVFNIKTLVLKEIFIC